MGKVDKGLRWQRVALWAAGLCGVMFMGCSTDVTSEPPGEDVCADNAASCDDGNPCTVDSCNAADQRCEHTAVPDGDLPNQVAGDCATDACEAGVLVSQMNSSDVLDDGKDCTLDACDSEGVPHNTPKPQGTLCMQGTVQGFCTALGDCMAICDEVIDPCDDGNPCTTDSCDLGASMCVYTALDGVPPPPPFAEPVGDCNTTLCVNGVQQTLADATDLPDDNNDCTNNECNGGIPAFIPHSAGTVCVGPGSNDVCNGLGACVECNVEDDCEQFQPDNACRNRFCNNNLCGQVLQPVGTVIALQNAGDCQVLQCDAMGNIVSVADDTDLPADMNVCTLDICTNGIPSNPPEPANTPCGVGMFCNGNGMCG